MIPLQNNKLTVMAQAVNTAANEFTSSYLDCLGYDIADVTITIGTQATTAGNQITIMKLKAGSDTNNSNAVDIAAFSGSTSGHSGTSTSFLIPAMDSSNAQIIKMNVNCRTVKRYLFACLDNPGAQAGPFSILGRLDRPEVSPVGATAQNVAISKNG